MTSIAVSAKCSPPSLSNIAKYHLWAANLVSDLVLQYTFNPSNSFWIVYAILTEIPATFLLYRSSFWSAAFLLLIFSVSVWNGGGFYIEVFGRK